MATIRFTKHFANTWSNLSWWGFDLDKIKISTADGNARYTLHWDGADDPGYDKIVINVDFDPNSDLDTMEDGDHAGTRILTGGTVTAITYFDDGARIAQITDIPSYLTPYLSNLSLSGADIARFFDTILALDNTYLGDGNGPSDAWDTGLADRIFTGTGDDQVNAKGGHDTIYDLGGRDSYNGGAGTDMLSYNQYWWSPVGIHHGIVADLAAGEVIGPDKNRDRIKNIEHIEGTFLADHIMGDALNNVFVGLGGADHFVGRDGTDILSYAQDRDQNGTGGIKVDTAAGTIRDGFGQFDSFTEIEHIIGTYTRDNFVDDDTAMVYEGRGGNDIFRVRGGDDTLIGGEGADEFNFIGTEFGENFLKDWEPGIDTVTINKLNDINQLSVFQVGSSAVVVFTGGGSSSSIVFENTQSTDLTTDVFGL